MPPDDRSERPALRDPEAIARQRVGAGKIGLEFCDATERGGVEAADPGAVKDIVTAERLHDLPLEARALQVDLQTDRRQSLRTERKGLVKRRKLGSHAPERIEAAAADTTARGAVADLAQVVGVREHERAVDEVEHVELEHVAPELDRQLQRA